MSPLLILILLTTGVNSAKILSVILSASFSHNKVYSTITEELARRGHEVITFTAHPIETDIINYKQVNMSEDFNPIWRKLIKDVMTSDRMSLIDISRSYVNNTFSILMEHEIMKELMSVGKGAVDLIFIESYMTMAVGFKEYFDAPIIGLNSGHSYVFNIEGIGVPTHPLFYSTLFINNDANENTLFDKIKKVKDYLKIESKFYYISELFESLAKKYFDTSLTAYELNGNFDLMINYDEICLGGIVPVVPKWIRSFGIHLKPMEPLPEDLGLFMDNAKQGVIYISLGSNILSKDLHSDQLDVFINVFKMLPYKVIWKYEGENLTVPDNVFLTKWAPQFHLLGHENMKLFITQGGILSMHEAIIMNTPMLIIPLITDQHENADKGVRYGIAEKIDINNLSEQVLNNTILAIMRNESYVKNCENLSARLLDLPWHPLDEVIWNVEYTIRHKTTEHLISPASYTNIIEYFMIDIMIASFVIVITLILISYFTLVKLLNIFKSK